MECLNPKSDAEKQKKLTPSIRSEIVRDFVRTMYAYMPNRNKAFCMMVANVTGYVSSIWNTRYSFVLRLRVSWMLQFNFAPPIQLLVEVITADGLILCCSFKHRLFCKEASLLGRTVKAWE